MYNHLLGSSQNFRIFSCIPSKVRIIDQTLALSGKLGMQVVLILLMNLVAGNFLANVVRCWLSSAQRGILGSNGVYNKE
jgi:hypothetical protein